MAKSKKEFNFSNLQNLSLDKQPDIEKAVEEVKPKAKKVEKKPAPTPTPKPKPRRGRPPKSENTVSASGENAKPKMKSTSFKIEEDLHRSLKEYSFFEEINMADYIFDLVKEDLKEKGYYPPRKRRKR